jgi:3-deoxy-manno-octulosonate cytidylyltransferase (CMP-KDO synthetase)
MSREITYKVVIPARYASSRLPGKPLVKISGVPMIERTWRQCIKACEPDDVIVATDDNRIMDYCKQIGAISVMTPESCTTGTDRIASLLNQYDVDYFINVQGDEPVLNPDDLLAIIDETKLGKHDVINGFAEIIDESLYRSSSVIKLVCDQNHMLMYMSRAPIPSNKSFEFVRSWRQIGIYSFSRKALDTFSFYTEKTPVEDIEDIEILRFLELGIPVKMIPMSNQSIAVDNESDISRVEAYLR